MSSRNVVNSFKTRSKVSINLIKCFNLNIGSNNTFSHVSVVSVSDLPPWLDQDQTTDPGGGHPPLSEAWRALLSIQRHDQNCSRHWCAFFLCNICSHWQPVFSSYERSMVTIFFHFLLFVHRIDVPFILHRSLLQSYKIISFKENIIQNSHLNVPEFKVLRLACTTSIHIVFGLRHFLFQYTFPELCQVEPVTFMESVTSVDHPDWSSS